MVPALLLMGIGLLPELSGREPNSPLLAGSLFLLGPALFLIGVDFLKLGVANNDLFQQFGKESHLVRFWTCTSLMLVMGLFSFALGCIGLYHSLLGAA